MAWYDIPILVDPCTGRHHGEDAQWNLVCEHLMLMVYDLELGAPRRELVVRLRKPLSGHETFSGEAGNVFGRSDAPSAS